MIKTIFLRQVLLEIQKLESTGKAVLVELEYRTFNSNNKQGGALKKIRARLLIKNEKNKNSFNPFEHEHRQFKSRKNPNHWENNTRNFELESGFIKKVNIRYITKFNGVEVVY